jgi:hypothetical protein
VARLSGSVIAGLLFASVAGCGGDGEGQMFAMGTWADGEVINYSQEARAARTATGLIEIRSLAGTRARFAGMRLQYDPTFVTGPGTFDVDAANNGRLELYCMRPKESTPDAVALELIEYEVTKARISFQRVPAAGQNLVEGSIAGVQLERGGAAILTLAEGRFRATVPSP